MSAALVFDYVCAAVFGLAGLVALRLCRTRPTRHQRAAAARAWRGLVPAAPDNTEGSSAADHAVCERIWDMPAYLDPSLEAGCDRLRDAIRDEQNKGDQ